MNKLEIKILDATVIIKFLDKMEYKCGFIKLSLHYELVVPDEVKSEVEKRPHKSSESDNLINTRVIKKVYVDQEKLKLLESKSNCGPGECAAVLYARSLTNNVSKVCIVSDDERAIKKFRDMHFKTTQMLLDIMRDQRIIDDIEYQIMGHRYKKTAPKKSTK